MSDPTETTHIPFHQTTTPTIERSNRFLSLKAHPGFYDLILLSQQLVQEASDQSRDYPGWDPQQMVVLKCRAQASHEHHEALLARMQNAINTGIAEATRLIAEHQLESKTAAEVIDQGDYVRQAVLEEFGKMDETRASGSF